LVCIKHPYNIEARLACPPPAIPSILPVVIKLGNVNGRLLREQSDSVAPYLLWGSPSASGGSLLLSPRQLANGVYYLTSALGGRVEFTQACPGTSSASATAAGGTGGRRKRQRKGGA
jgi:hypothetical protein